MTEHPRLAGWRLQLATALVAGALWSVYPHASVGAAVVAYVIAWVVLQAIGRPRLEPRVGVVLALVLAAAPVVRAGGLLRRFAENEGLMGIEHQVESRAALQQTPAIFPRLVSLDQPQTFYVQAPGAETVDVSFDDAMTTSEALGHGLFRVRFDPGAEDMWDALLEREAAPSSSEATLDVTIYADDVRHERQMQAVRPLAHPRWLTPSPDRSFAAAVSEETDELYFVSLDEPPQTLATSDGPVGAVFVSDDEVAVAHRHASTLLFCRRGEEGCRNRVTVVGRFTTHLASYPGGPIVLARDAESPELVFVDSDTRQVTRRVPLDFTPDWVAFGADERTVIVSALGPAALHRFVDGEPAGEPIALTRPVVAMSGGGPTVLVSVTDYQPEGAEHLGNHFVRDTILAVDTGAWRVTRAWPTATRTERQRSPGDLDRGVSPIGLDLAPDGSVWVAFAGTDDIARYAPGQPVPERHLLDEQPLAAPISVVALDGGFAVSSAVYGAIGLFDERGERIALARFAPHDQELLENDEGALKRRIGERTFYESTRAGVSCQSCHLHGGSDGGRHNIGGSTLVATLDVRGVMGTPPYLRDGGYPTLGSLDDVAQTLYRGYRRRQGGRRPSLDAYLAALPRDPPRREERDLERERRGLDAFVRARCVVCHAFPAFTDLSQHAAEWLFPGRDGNESADDLDTPSLLGLGRSAPFLVDGRAPTVDSVMTEHDPSGRHGHAEVLDDAERADLVYLLEGL